MPSKTTRKLVTNVLSSFTKTKKNANIIESKLYEKVKYCDDDTYKWYSYQIVGCLCSSKDKKALKNIKKGLYGWKDPIYSHVAELLREHDDYIVNPFDVVEGIAECGNCGSNKTWSIQKQTRGGDEPLTTFSRCAVCKHTWSYSG